MLRFVVSFAGLAALLCYDVLYKGGPHFWVTLRLGASNWEWLGNCVLGFL